MELFTKEVTEFYYILIVNLAGFYKGDVLIWKLLWSMPSNVNSRHTRAFVKTDG